MSVSKRGPKVIAISLYTSLAYEKFHSMALLSVSGGNLYIDVWGDTSLGNSHCFGVSGSPRYVFNNSFTLDFL